jgi:hypothetical protein
VAGLQRAGGDDSNVPVQAASRLGGSKTPMQRPDERELREQLARLRTEHRDLDAEIAAQEACAMPDQLYIQRLKKKKLALKDRITAIEDQLLPDITA